MQTNFQKILTTLAAIALLGVSASASAQIPTTDGANLAAKISSYQQQIQDFMKQSQQLQSLQQQLQTAKSTLETAKENVNAVKGVYNYGTQTINGVQTVIGSVPRSMDDMVNMAGVGKYGDDARKIAAELQSLDKKKYSGFYSSHQGMMYDRSIKATQAAILTTDKSIANLNKHVENLKRLGRQVDSASTVKESQDLQNAIQIEMAAANTNLMMLQAAHLKIQAEINNRTNQDEQDKQIRMEMRKAAYEAEYGKR